MDRSALSSGSLAVMCLLVGCLMKVEAARFSADRALVRPVAAVTQAAAELTADDGYWAVWAAAAAAE